MDSRISKHQREHKRARFPLARPGHAIRIILLGNYGRARRYRHARACILSSGSDAIHLFSEADGAVMFIEIGGFKGKLRMEVLRSLIRRWLEVEDSRDSFSCF